MRRFTLRKSATPVLPGSAENIAFFKKDGSPLDLAENPTGWHGKNVVIDPADAIVVSNGEGDGMIAVRVSPVFTPPMFGEINVLGWCARNDSAGSEPPCKLGWGPIVDGSIWGFDTSEWVDTFGSIQSGDDLFGVLNREPASAEFGMALCAALTPDQEASAEGYLSYLPGASIYFAAGNTEGEYFDLTGLTQSSVQDLLDLAFGDGVATLTEFEFLEAVGDDPGPSESGTMSYTIVFSGPGRDAFVDTESGTQFRINGSNTQDESVQYRQYSVAPTEPFTIDEIVAVYHNIAIPVSL